MDNPSFTHPLMYKLIKNIVPVKEQYKKQLIDMGIDTAKLATRDSKFFVFEISFIKLINRLTVEYN